MRAEARNAYRAYDVAGLRRRRHGRQPGRPRATARPIAERLAARLPVPCYVAARGRARSPRRPSRQIAHALGAEVLLGDDAGLARDARDFVFGGAMLPTFLNALTPGCLVVTPGRPRGPGRRLARRAQRRHPADRRCAAHPGRAARRPDILALAARLAPGTPVVSVPGGSFPTAAELFALEGKLNAATPRKAETALGLFERHVDTGELTRPASRWPAAAGSRR